MCFVTFRSPLGVGWLIPEQGRFRLQYLLREPLQRSERATYHHEVVLNGLDDVVQLAGVDWLIDRETGDFVLNDRPEATSFATAQ
jgi:hypothetical protein